MQKRLQEMMSTVVPKKKHGEVVNLETDLHFLNAVDNEEKTCTIFILIHEVHEYYFLNRLVFRILWGVFSIKKGIKFT